MSSAIKFRLKSGKEWESIFFDGHQIKLLDLKRLIMEKKNMSNSSLDFDLQISDADNSTKVYEGDDTFVPKNTNVIVKRIPASSGTGLLSRIHGNKSANLSKQDSTIVIPAKQEPIPAQSAPSSNTMMSFKSSPQPSAIQQPSIPTQPLPPPLPPTAPTPSTPLAEPLDEEAQALRALNIRAAGASRMGRPGSNMIWNPGMGGDPNMNAQFQRGRGGGPMGGAGMMMQGPNRRPQGVPPPNYVCNRCGQPGHYIHLCPTNGDPAYDRPRAVEVGPTKMVDKVHGVPQNAMKRVKDLNEVDTTGKLVKPTREGFEILEPSNLGLQTLVRQQGATSALTSLDKEDIPPELRCAYSNNLLRDASQLPCCGQAVCDSLIREALVNFKLKCPLCQTENVMTDELLPLMDVRRNVEEFLRQRETAARAAGMDSQPPPPPIPPNVAAPLPPMPPPSNERRGPPPPPPPAAPRVLGRERPPPPTSSNAGAAEQPPLPHFGAGGQGNAGGVGLGNGPGGYGQNGIEGIPQPNIAMGGGAELSMGMGMGPGMGNVGPHGMGMHGNMMGMGMGGMPPGMMGGPAGGPGGMGFGMGPDMWAMGGLPFGGMGPDLSMFWDFPPPLTFEEYRIEKNIQRDKLRRIRMENNQGSSDHSSFAARRRERERERELEDRNRSLERRDRVRDRSKSRSRDRRRVSSPDRDRRRRSQDKDDDRKRSLETSRGGSVSRDGGRTDPVDEEPGGDDRDRRDNRNRGGKDRDKDRENEKEKEKDRERDRERERDRVREKEKRLEKDRETERIKEKEKELKEKEKEREKERDKEKKREKDIRDVELERERDRGRKSKDAEKEKDGKPGGGDRERDRDRDRDREQVSQTTSSRVKRAEPAENDQGKKLKDVREKEKSSDKGATTSAKDRDRERERDKDREKERENDKKRKTEDRDKERDKDKDRNRESKRSKVALEESDRKDSSRDVQKPKSSSNNSSSSSKLGDLHREKASSVTKSSFEDSRDKSRSTTRIVSEKTSNKDFVSSKNHSNISNVDRWEMSAEP